MNTRMPGLRAGMIAIAAAFVLAAGGHWTAHGSSAATPPLNFGNTSSAGADDTSDFGYINGSNATLSTDGTLSSLSVYVGATPANAHVRLALYTANGSGDPGALVAQTASVVAAVGWNTIAVSPAVAIGSGQYWFVAQTDNSGTVYRVTAGMPSSTFVGWAPQAYAAFPSTISGWSKGSTQAFSMYGTVAVAPDSTPPVITNIAVSGVTTTSATITWTTDEPSTSQVAYGATSAYGSLAPASADPSLVVSHSQTLSGLATASTYHFSVISADASANQAASADQTFATTADPCSGAVQQIVCENTKPGNPASEWDVSGSGDASIQGFATDISVNKGTTVRFKVKTAATAYRFDIYRMGYYGGMGARKVATFNPSAALPQSQPACMTNSTGIVDCGNWADSGSWAVPSTAVSGIYFARLTRTDGTSGASHIFFIVRDDASHSDILFQTSDTTWQAYNSYGGNSLYIGSPSRATKVSYNRPFSTRTGDSAGSSADFVFNAEYPMVRWLEANGYDVTYFTGVDSDRNGALIKQHKIFMSVGHDEYWSGNQRANVESARDAGVNLAFMSGNEATWKTRWENSISSPATSYRTLVTYKEPSSHDPQDPPTWTGAWRNPAGGAPADGNRPENGLTGTLSTVECCTYAITVPGTFAPLRFWRNTSVAALSPGGSATLLNGSLGYEWDEDLDNGARPAGLVDMSSTTVNVTSYAPMPGGPTTSGTAATHKLTLYRAPSGALVFGAGTVQWSWGLDGNHDNGSSSTDVRMKQATVNLFADMHAQPSTLAAGLVAASATTDATAPTAVIASPVSGATLAVGVPATISGTASDAGGGVVAAVEVSTDNGATWHPASGLANWNYQFTPSANGTLTIKARAADDSANLQAAPASVTVTAGSGGSGNVFGLTSSGGANDSFDNGYINGSPGTLQTAGTLQSISIYVGATSGAGHIRAAVYTNNASGVPGSLLAQSADTVAQVGWNNLPISGGPALAAGTYWILAQTDNASTVFRITSGLSASNAVGWVAQAYAAFPATLSGFSKQTGQAFDMYGTVGAAGTPTATATATSTSTATATPTASATATITATATATRTPTATGTATATATATSTGAPTATSTATPTATSTPVATATSTATPTATATATSSATPTSTATSTPTSTATATPTGGQTVTFGITTSAGTNDSSDFGYINGSRYTLSTAGTLTSLSVYVGSTPAGAHVRLAVYTNNASGNPATLLAQSAVITAAAGWNTVPISAGPKLAAGTYWILAQTDNTSTVYRIQDALPSSSVVGWKQFAYAAFPSSAGNGWSKATGQAFDMYATLSVP